MVCAGNETLGISVLQLPDIRGLNFLPMYREPTGEHSVRNKDDIHNTDQSHDNALEEAGYVFGWACLLVSGTDG